MRYFFVSIFFLFILNFNCYLFAQNIEPKIDSLEKILSEKYRDEVLKAYSNMYIADTYFELSRFKLAIDYYEQALEYFYEQRP